MYRYIDLNGKEQAIGDVVAFAEAVQDGRITENTLVHSSQVGRWTPAGELDVFRLADAMSERPAQKDAGTAGSTGYAAGAPCRTCGHQLSTTHPYCPSCGEKVVEEWKVMNGPLAGRCFTDEGVRSALAAGDLDPDAAVQGPGMVFPLRVRSVPAFAHLFADSGSAEADQHPSRQHSAPVARTEPTVLADVRPRASAGPANRATADKKSAKKAPWGIVAIGLTVVVFGGARVFHPGGMFGIARDATITASATPGFESIRKQMVAGLAPIGAAALCTQKFGEDRELESAARSYNNRHRRAMAALVRRAEEVGLSRAEKDLIDREAGRRAHALLGAVNKTNCESLAIRFRTGEFDL